MKVVTEKNELSLRINSLEANKPQFFSECLYEDSPQQAYPTNKGIFTQ